MSRKTILFFLYTMLVLLPIVTFGETGTTYTFRFVADDDMFYVPWNGNGDELTRLLAYVEQNKADILAGKIPLYVDGYCNSQSNPTENLAMAKTRANRVKTELILREDLTEKCFITKNHISGGNYVTVRIVLPAGPTEAELEAQRRAEAERLAAEERAEHNRLAIEKQKAEEARLVAEQAEAERLAAEQADQEQAEAAIMAAAE